MQQGGGRMRLSTTERISTLSRVGTLCMTDVDEAFLFHLVTETAYALTGASFAALCLRPLHEENQPDIPSESHLFSLASVVGVMQEQEALLHRMWLGGEGALAPLFRHGKSVLVSDIFTLPQPEAVSLFGLRERADQAEGIFDAFGHYRPPVPTNAANIVDRPREQPTVRSFLGVPLLDRAGQVRAGLLLGHPAPGHFTEEDEVVMVGLVALAAVALEKTRWSRLAEQRAQDLDQVVEQVSDGITFIDQHEAILRENPAARRMREQLTCTPEGEQATNSWQLAPARSAMQGETVQNRPVSLSLGNGELREYLVTASPLSPLQMASGLLRPANEAIPTERESASRAVVIWHEVTDRRLAEAEHEARVQADQLRAAFEAITDAVVVYDRAGTIVQANAAAARAFWAQHLPEGTTSRSMEERVSQVALSATDGQPPAPRLTPEQALVSRILAGEVLTPDNAADLIFPSLQGRDLCVSMTGGPMRDADGTIIGAVSIVRDVTVRRSLEQLTRRIHAETEARVSLLQLILDQLPSSVYLVRGYDARLVLANRAATMVWGKPWPAGQPLNVFLRENGILIFGMDGQPLPHEQLATVRALQRGETVRHHQEIIRHPDGSTLPFLVNAVELTAPNLLMVLALAVAQPFERWEPVALVVHQDLTALKEAERLKDEFLSIAAHELRNPLAALKGYAQMLLVQTARGKGTPLLQWQKEALQEIDQATSRLDILTEDLLDVTRLQAGRLGLYVEPMDLVALARRIITRLQTTTNRHALSLHSSLSSVVLQADPGRMEQVLTNLIGNAIKYSPEGGPIKVSIRQRGGTEEVLLSVRDYGIGIPEQQQACIFGRFVRAQNAQTHGISGAGLGLYLCRTLVELHGGKLWFRSAEGQGTIFFLTLPILPKSLS